MAPPPDVHLQPAVSVQVLREEIADVAHELSGSLGILRLASHHLLHATLDDEKRTHYCRLIGKTVERVDRTLERLRELSDAPADCADPSATSDTP